MQIKGLGVPPSRYLEGVRELSREAQKRLAWFDLCSARSASRRRQ